MKKKVTTNQIIIVCLILATIILWGIVAVMLFSSDKMVSEDGYTYFRMPGIYHSVTASGVYELIILLLVLAAIFLFIIDVVLLRKKNIYSASILNDLENNLRSQQFQETYQLCANDDTSLSEIVEQSLSTKPAEDETQSDFFDMMEHNAQRVMLRILKKPNKYLLLSVVSLLFGIFGMIRYMLDIFGAIQHFKSPTPSDLAPGFWGSMIIVAVGLIILLINILFYFFIRNKANSYVFELKGVYERLIVRLKRE